MDADPRAEALLAGGAEQRLAFVGLALRLAGHGPAEVSRRLGVSRQALYRARAWLPAEWSALAPPPRVRIAPRRSGIACTCGKAAGVRGPHKPGCARRTSRAA